jgi:cell division protein FtsZ
MNRFLINVPKVIVNKNQKRFLSEGLSLQKAFLRSVKPSTVSDIDVNNNVSDKLSSSNLISDNKDVKIDNVLSKPWESVSSQKITPPSANTFNKPLITPPTRPLIIPNPAATNLQEFLPRICVVGVGGGGCNAINNMVARGLSGVDFICTNTDAQHLATTLTDRRIQLGRSSTQGLGCGANPEVGRAAAEESRAEIAEMIGDAHMVFITAGMGGGTGTGAAPVVAEICMERGILTVAVVTKPFSFEGRHRARLASEGLKALQDRTDTLIVIPNQNLFRMIDQSTSVVNAFGLADDVLLAGVKSITDLMVNPGLINLDFADVQAVMSGMGNALMGTGQADGEDRAVRAAKDALKNPLLGGDISVKTAKGMLVSIVGGQDLTLFEVDQAAQHITSEIEDENANIIFGSSFDPNLNGSIRVSIVATGIDVNAK